MLSILIPVYNFDVTQFVSDLHRQAVKENIDFEIIVADDASQQTFRQTNSKVADLPKVQYLQLEENIGRAAIRNFLTQHANYDFLLFLDGDSKVNDEKFIHRYIVNIHKESVVYGGRNYEKTPPEDENRHLRWIYGVKRETIGCETRQQYPYKSFMTNNFVVPKKIAVKIPFEEKIVKGYGHEDTLFGLELKQLHIPIIHINNPLCHIGLETTDEFLQKTEEGIKNLYQLIINQKIDDSVKLYRLFKQLEKTKTTPFVANYFVKNKENIIKKIKQKKNPLRWFDVYKIGYLCALKHGLV